MAGMGFHHHVRQVTDMTDEYRRQLAQHMDDRQTGVHGQSAEFADAGTISPQGIQLLSVLGICKQTIAPVAAQAERADRLWAQQRKR